MYQVGSIILVENQIFDMCKDNSRTQIDHAKKRPAIIIAETEDYFYYLTLTSKPGNGTFYYKTNGTIKSNGKIKIEKTTKKQYIQVRHIYKKKIYGAIEITRISDVDLLYLLSRVYGFHEKRNYNNFEDIKKELLLEMKKISQKLQNKENKKSNYI